ncbi:helix-turn-helix domain-containing protein [Roseivirga sp.]|uniref:helix-turn-helix domain-containing protein n=1 Tax=Roseivirga sp. TaxID=1964215 RepID=UPI003B8BEF05
MDIKIDIWIILFIAASAQGIFLSFMLFIRASKLKKAKESHYILATLMLLFTVTLIYYLTFWTGINSQLSPYLRVILRFTLLFGPLFYAYTFKQLFQHFPKRIWLHTSPFILINIWLIIMPILAPNLINHSLFNAFMSVHLLVYASYCVVLTSRNNQIKGLFNAAISFLAYALCLLTYYVLAWSQILKLQHDYIVSLGMTLFIYLIGYHGFKMPIEGQMVKDEKYQNSMLSNQSLQHIMERLNSILIDEKLFTKGNLKLTDLSVKLGVSSHDISQAINVMAEKRFSDYINSFRVQEAIELMQSDFYKNEKLIAVALDSGFNNKTSFLNAFKKQTGKTPSDFRKEMYSKAS